MKKSARILAVLAAAATLGLGMVSCDYWDTEWYKSGGDKASASSGSGSGSGSTSNTASSGSAAYAGNLTVNSVAYTTLTMNGDASSGTAVLSGNGGSANGTYARSAVAAAANTLNLSGTYTLTFSFGTITVVFANNTVTVSAGSVAASGTASVSTGSGTTSGSGATTGSGTTTTTASTTPAFPMSALYGKSSTFINLCATMPQDMETNPVYDTIQIVSATEVVYNGTTQACTISENGTGYRITWGEGGLWSYDVSANSDGSFTISGITGAGTLN